MYLGKFKCKLQMTFYNIIVFILALIILFALGTLCLNLQKNFSGYTRIFFLFLSIFYIVMGLFGMYVVMLDIKTVGKYEIYEKGYKNIITDKIFLFKNVSECHYVERDYNRNDRERYLIVRNGEEISIFSTKMGKNAIWIFLENYNNEVLKYKIENIRSGSSEKFEVRKISKIGKFIYEGQKKFLEKIQKFELKFIIEIYQEGLKIDNELYSWDKIEYKIKQIFSNDNLEIYEKENNKIILEIPLYFIENYNLLLMLMESFGIKYRVN